MTDPTKPEDASEVTQADRERACRIMEDRWPLAGVKGVLAGLNDHWIAVVECARHRLAASASPVPITMQDVRQIAGEGKLSAQTVLDAVNVVLRQRGGTIPSSVNDPENLAKAIREFQGERGAVVKLFDNGGWQVHNRDMADAMQKPIPPGWRLVPVEMTEAMALAIEFGPDGDAENGMATFWQPSWSAALAAAPVPPAGQREEG